MDDHIILQHDKKSLSKLPIPKGVTDLSVDDLRILNRYLTLIKRRKSPAQAEEITAQEFGIDEIQMAKILSTTHGSRYIAATVEKLSPTREIVRHSVMTNMLDVLTFNIADCYHPGTNVPLPIEMMPLDAQAAIKYYGPDKSGNTVVEFYSRMEAARLLSALDRKNQLGIPDQDESKKSKKKRGMFDHLTIDADYEDIVDEIVEDDEDETDDE